MSQIVVVGSCSMDLVVTSNKRPNAGETVLGESFKTVPGGKGANQAVASARLGADVYMIGRVGDDAYGQDIMSNLQAQGVRTTYMKPVTEMESGTAHIILAEGDNSIVVVKGANNEVTPHYVKDALSSIENIGIVLIQQEIPEETVEAVCTICSEKGIPVILNPAPARKVSQQILDQAAYITPNEHEAALMFDGLTIAEALRQYPNKLLITEGKNGVRYFDGSKEVLVPGYPVKAVDTTGAGDTFNGALAVALTEGKSLYDALAFANLAASISVTKFGAQGGMPAREELENKK
ncbi:ribokinase [Bacillus altitudinis MN12]|uniref:ribokinase n=1 Tax=Bacillus TaxID=1386 RepID=UPI000C230C16|nr:MULTISPECIES: ribokinase [Bacillus]MBR0583502.1 ribokinase [Bacillus altitudinis MN12]MBR0593636.1 ribokinase [Bacillus altitudinis C16B11]MBR0610686.1 ribokinase [Bacillus altitudinis]MCW4357467.1 ribokinase [Bacillus altitudinis]MCY7628423.1 ribokinase [Bacillus altitudinis]